jgi:lipopolysaccharide transport system permease protein
MRAHYLQLIFYRARAALTAEATKTYLSFAWWILDPVISVCVYYVVFAVILGRGVGDYVTFLLVGLLIYQWFSTSISNSTNSIENAAELVLQVRFPKAILPLTVVVVNTYKFSLVFLVLLGYLSLRGYQPSIEYLALVPIFLVLFLTMAAGAIVVACIVPLVPDFQYIVSNLLRAVMFLSAIFYPISTIPDRYQPYFLMNPLVPLIESTRGVIIEHRWPDWIMLLYPAGMALFLLALAIWLSSRLDPRFARILAQR